MVIRALESACLPVLRRVEHGFNQIFGERWNPWYQLGALSFYLFWLIAISGLYLFIFFDTSIVSAFDSVEYMTHEQWYLAGVMRSIHRYASDGMAITVSLHLLREFALGRFRGARWFSWFSGIPLLWLLFAAAIGGYWLVWDQLAQYIAVATTEWIDWLPVFSDPLSRNFLSDLTLNDRLFSLLVFLHVAIPLLLLIGMFIHTKRMKLPRTSPPRGLAVGTTVALLVLSAIKPAVSMPRADLSITVANVNLDWFYLNVFPLFDSWGPGWVWALLVGGSTIVGLLPWLSPERKQSKPVAVVNPANCNGCSWCFQDCPHEAILMVEHDYKKGHRQATVIADLCTSCGICAGACPSATPFRHVDELVSGIEVPNFSVDDLREQARERIARLGADGGIVLFGCDHAVDVEKLQSEELAVLSLPCIGQLPPSFVDYLARQESVHGVLISGCCGEDCYYRLGSEWSEQRFEGVRMPHLRTKVGQEKIKVCWAGAQDTARVQSELESFKAQLAVADNCEKEGQR